MKDFTPIDVCRRCGANFFQTSQRLKRYCGACSARTNRSRDVARQQHKVEFIGVDGEGVTRPDGRHEYILLSVGNHSLYKTNGARLNFLDIIPFLWNCFLENTTASYVGFYLGYDFAQWFKDLPFNRAKYLFDTQSIRKRERTKSGSNHLPFPVEYEGWIFDIMPNMKRFRLWRDGSDLRMYICDAGAFFQTSFLNAINPTNWPTPIVSSDEYKIIEVGKSERGVDIVEYNTPVDPEMIEYNILENTILARLMTSYNEGLNDIDIHLKRNQWFGPGQVAQAWMNSIKAPKREQFEKITPLEIRTALRATYYGGWFEIFAHGHVGEAWSYDINSAYPNIQSRLPCLLHGRWIHNESKNQRSYRQRNRHTTSTNYKIVYGTFEGTNRFIGAAPYRGSNGRIYRPNKVKGWYWWHEIHAGIMCGIISNVNIEESYEYKPCDCPPPFASERDLYLDRLRIGKNSVEGKARKLAYNSAYGKTAQSVGSAKYANMFYASYITSMCRTQLLQAVITHDVGVDHVLMVATDSITFRTPHRNLNLDKNALGAWTETKHDNLTLFMPGIYWDDKTREKLKDGQHPSLKSRGIPSRSLIARLIRIDALFSNPSFRHSGEGFPTIDIPLHLSLISPKQAMARGKWYLCGHIDFDTIRTIDSDPSNKRAGAYMDRGIVRSWCYNQGIPLETTPYTKAFGDEELRELDQRLTPDGDMEMIVAEILRSPP